MSQYNGLKLSMNNFIETTITDYIVVFDENFADPETFEAGAKWVTPIYSGYDPSAVVKSVNLHFYCFTKGDEEGLELSKMIDKIFNVFSDPTQNDGNKRIPLNVVDGSTLLQVSTLIASDMRIEESFRLGDSTVAQALAVTLMWC